MTARAARAAARAAASACALACALGGCAAPPVRVPAAVGAAGTLEPTEPAETVDGELADVERAFEDPAAEDDLDAGTVPFPSSETVEGESDEASGEDDEDGGLGVLGTVGRVVEMVDGAQAAASERFDAFMLDLDDFFAGDIQTDESNTSYVRVRLDAVSPAVGSFEIDPAVKLRVVLPRTEERVRFLFSTEEDPGALGERVGEGLEIGETVDDDSVSFALRFVRGAREMGDTSFDLGARQRDGRLQIFTRVRLEIDARVGERWTARASDRWYYYYVSGYENQLRLDFTRPLDAGNDRFVRLTTTFDWERDRKGASIGQTIGAYAELSPRTALAAELLARYDTSVARGASDRYRGAEARLRLRRNVWRPWFFYELWPSVAWPAETDYRRVWNGLARIEVTIGGRYREFPADGTGGSGP